MMTRDYAEETGTMIEAFTNLATLKIEPIGNQKKVTLGRQNEISSNYTFKLIDLESLNARDRTKDKVEFPPGRPITDPMLRAAVILTPHETHLNLVGPTVHGALRGLFEKLCELNSTFSGRKYALSGYQDADDVSWFKEPLDQIVTVGPSGDKHTWVKHDPVKLLGL